jgi:hypothetical protein
MILDLDKLRAEQPRLYRALVDAPGFNDGSDEYSDDLKSQLIAWSENQISLVQSPSAPKQPEPPAAPTETLREWQLPLDATEAQIRKASFLVRRDLAKRQHEAAVREKRRALGSHSVKFP